MYKNIHWLGKLKFWLPLDYHMMMFTFCIEMFMLFWQDTEIYLWVFTEICSA